jgi:hypothetical protein
MFAETLHSNLPLMLVNALCFGFDSLALEEVGRERQHQARHDRASDDRRGWFQALAITNRVCKSSICKRITRLQYGETRL